MVKDKYYIMMNNLIEKKSEKEEKEYLLYVLKVINQKITELEDDLGIISKAIYRHNKYIYQNNASMDSGEKNFLLAENEVSEFIHSQKNKYYKNLVKIKDSPYFAFINFTDENEINYPVYIGITYLLDNENNQHLIYDWRAPISSLYYDYEIGEASYEAPEGIIKGKLNYKRQFKIIDGKIKYIFDNSLNIDDDILQETLLHSNNDKMRNIVNTIQQEQNKVIRNTKHKVLIVQGVAGSGKTSVALHRIAYLLYKINNLKNTDVLIFSPNEIFSEYISNVLPELGEENAFQTTFYQLMKDLLPIKIKIENYDEFLKKIYSNEQDINYLKYIQSDQIIIDIDNYINYLNNNIYFINNFVDKKFKISSSTLNNLVKVRYKNYPILKKIELMSYYISNKINDSDKGSKKIEKKLLTLLNYNPSIKALFNNFFSSDFCKIKKNIKSNQYAYMEGILFVYFIGKIKGFESKKIKQVVIDEAQDYTKLQYLILKNIFKNSSFTILGDNNQTVNPFNNLKNLSEIQSIFDQDSIFLKLEKTYRSSPEIIEFTNKILNLKNIKSIRKSDNIPVIAKRITNIVNEILITIKKLKKRYTKIAIIYLTLDDYNILSDNLKNEDFNFVLRGDSEINNTIPIIPAYLSKGLEFEAILVFSKSANMMIKYSNLFYVACTRAQHELIIYYN